MNAQLSHQMAQMRQHELHRAGEQARQARTAAGPSRLSALCQKLVSTRTSRPQPQQTPAHDPLLRAKLGI